MLKTRLPLDATTRKNYIELDRGSEVPTRIQHAVTKFFFKTLND